MSSPLMFARDGRTLAFVPVTLAALAAIRDATPKRRPYATATYMALLELCNEARDARVAISLAMLADRVGAGRTAIKTALVDLHGAGLLYVREQVHGRGRIENEYVVIEPGQKQGAESDTPGRETTDPQSPHDRPARTHDPRTEEELQEVGVRASTAVDKDESSPAVFDGKRVPPSRLRLAEDLLDEFNAEANTSYSAFTGDGKPSESLKRILGALTEHPDIDGAVWSQGLAAQFVEPWWTSTPAPGVVFGRGQREKTLQLARSGRVVARAESPRDRQLRERQERSDQTVRAMSALHREMGIGDENRAAKERRDAQRQLVEGS